ncbi:hypothetical protein HMPREF9431_00252 [Segatella oulorum F0390]|uniref:Uncharacterized protein n=1 Tax=Segatella oulorum F0390 TaxID=702438 RepID=G1W8V1_9BACT|nr:hypothetical protein HMPREF9431_00252 [Segatella oulorum F0390]
MLLFCGTCKFLKNIKLDRLTKKANTLFDSVTKNVVCSHVTSRPLIIWNHNKNNTLKALSNIKMTVAPPRRLHFVHGICHKSGYKLLPHTIR